MIASVSENTKAVSLFAKIFKSFFSFDMVSRDVPIPHFKPILILLPIPAFRADIDTVDTTNTFLSIEHHQ